MKKDSIKNKPIQLDGKNIFTPYKPKTTKSNTTGGKKNNGK